MPATRQKSVKQSTDKVTRKQQIMKDKYDVNPEEIKLFETMQDAHEIRNAITVSENSDMLQVDTWLKVSKLQNLLPNALRVLR